MAVRRLKGSYWVDFGATVRGTRLRVRKRSPVQTAAGSRDYETLLRSRLMRGEPLEDRPEPSAKTTFSEFASEWFETYVKANNKPSEQYHKSMVLRVHLLPFFGKLELRNVTAEHVERYKAAKRASGLAAITINLHLGMLAKCLRTAIEWNRVKEMPKIARLKVEQKMVSFLTPPESERLLAYARRHATEWHDIILLALRTGMRRGELLGLQWGDIDLERLKITVRHSMVMGLLGSPKNGRFRIMPMSPEVREMLAARTDKRGFVFQSVTGGASTKSTLDRNLRRICGGAGMAHVHWHTFRHTFASQLAASGLPLNIVQGLMGHSDIKMTMRYAHFSPTLYDRAVDVLDMLGKKEPEIIDGQPVGNRPQIAAPAAPTIDLNIRLSSQQKSTTR